MKAIQTVKLVLTEMTFIQGQSSKVFSSPLTAAMSMYVVQKAPIAVVTQKMDFLTLQLPVAQF